MFDYNQYWSEIGKTMKSKWYPSEITRNQEYNILESLKGLKFDSVLELGVGFGRITNIIINNFKIKRYTGVDLSKEQLEHVKRDFPSVEIIHSTIEDFVSKDTWDLVIASEVLMHIIPRNIDYILKKMLKWSKKYIVSLDYNPTESARFNQLDTHNWEYDYKEKYSMLGLDVKERRISDLQSIFICRVKQNEI